MTDYCPGKFQVINLTYAYSRYHDLTSKNIISRLQISVVINIINMFKILVILK